MARSNHECENFYHAECARGGCYLEIRGSKGDEIASLEVGWSCVRVFNGEIPVTWLAELIAIATNHKGGIGGFLAEHNYSGESYALMCDHDPKASTNG